MSAPPRIIGIGKQTRQERIAARGHTAEAHSAYLDDIGTQPILKKLAKPTLDAHKLINTLIIEWKDWLRSENITQIAGYDVQHFTTNEPDVHPPIRVFLSLLVYYIEGSKGIMKEKITVVTLRNKIGLVIGFVSLFLLFPCFFKVFKQILRS